MRFLKDKFYTGLFRVLLHPKMWIVSVFAWWIFFMKFGGISTLDYHGFEYAVLITIAIGGGLLFLRFKYFDDIPQNMSREQWEDWKKVEAFVVPNKFHIPPFCLGIICACAVAVGFGVVFGSGLYALVPVIIIGSGFYWVTKHARKETRAEKVMRENHKALWESEQEARHGRHYKKWMLVGWLWGMFGWIGLFFNFYFIIVYIGVFVFMGSRIKGKDRGGNAGGMSGIQGVKMKMQRYHDNKMTDDYDYLRGLDTSITDKNGNLKGLHNYD